MSKTRTSFIFSSSLLAAIEKLPPELKGEFMTAIAVYAIRGEEPQFSELAEVIWNLIRDIVDRDNMRRDSAQRNLRNARDRKACKGNGDEEEDSDDGSDGGAQDSGSGTPDAVPVTRTEQRQQFQSHEPNSGSSLCNTNENIVSHKEKFPVTQTACTGNRTKKAVSEPKEGTIGVDNIPPSKRKERLPTGVQRKEDNSAAPYGATRQRKLKFGLDVWAYREKYTREMLRAFYDYWSEENRTGVKMRFEMERTWQLGRRLAVWANRDRQYGRSPYVSAAQPAVAGDIMAHVAIEKETKTAEEKYAEERGKYLMFVRKADKPGPLSKTFRDILTDAYNSGRLQSYGIQWAP